MDQLSEVIKYILYRCRENNTPITEIMASFIAQTIFNPRTEKFYLEDKLSESQMRELKELAIKKILSKESLQMKTISLQVNYDTQFLETEIRKQTETQNEAIASGEHTDQVTNHEVKNAKDFEGLSQLYKKIYNFLLFKSKAITEKSKLQQCQGKIQKEVAAALQSVIPRAALAPFVTLSSSQKLVQLVQLSNLVIGIRLFNQQIGKGGSGLLKVQQLMNNDSTSIKQHIFREVQDINQQSEKYGDVFHIYQKGKLELQSSEFKRLKNQLTFIRQYKSFLISLAQQIEASEASFQANGLKYEKEIEDLKILLGSKSSAPKEQVYPKFAILAQAYVSIFEQRKYFEDKVRLYNLLKEFRKGFPLSLSSKFHEKVAQLLESLPNETTEHIVEDPNSGIQISMPHNSPDFMQKDCDYLGYCIWSLVKHNGLLMPGKPELGVYKYKDKNCVFSTVQAIEDFLKQPQFFILGVMEECRKHPQLIYFLRLEEAFKNVKLSLVSQAVQGGIKNKLMVDKGIETPVHFIEKNIDPSYCWNEWQLRKKAIQMANIRKTQTRGDQTLLSNFRVDSDVQTYLKKDAETNTTKNSGTQYKTQKESTQKTHDVGI